MKSKIEIWKNYHLNKSECGEMTLQNEWLNSWKKTKFNFFWHFLISFVFISFLAKSN